MEIGEMRTKAVIGWFAAWAVIAVIAVDHYIHHEVRRQVKSQIKARIEEHAMNQSKLDQIIAGGSND